MRVGRGWAHGPWGEVQLSPCCRAHARAATCANTDSAPTDHWPQELNLDNNLITEVSGGCRKTCMPPGAQHGCSASNCS